MALPEEKLGIPYVGYGKGERIRVADTVLAHADRIEQLYREQSEKEFLCFTKGLIIAGQQGPNTFYSVMQDFQLRDFTDIAPSLEALRDGKIPPRRRWWIERTKKAAKDSDLAVMILWLLAFPRKPFYIQVGAANRVQAGIVKERMQNLLHYNDWLNAHVEMIQSTARSVKRLADGSPMATLHILSADVAGAHGGTPDLLLINELSHITPVKWEFAENLMHNADGVAQGMVVVATNAGFKGTKAEVWRNNAMKSDDWEIRVFDKPAPWHSKEAIEDNRRRSPRSSFQRLWHGRWQSGKGDALTEEDIDRCFVMDGPVLYAESGWTYIAGLDLGISHDHSGLVVLGVNERLRKLKTAYWKAWAPGLDRDVDLIDVANECRKVHKLYGLKVLLYDPHEARLMSQQLRRLGINLKEQRFIPSNLDKMASCLMQVVESHILECYDDEEGRLRRDFGKFNIVEKSYGYKLEAVSDEFGHADVGTALVICLPTAIEMLGGISGLSPEDDLTADNEELTQEEIDAMPEELRGIYTMYDEQEVEARGRKMRDPFKDWV